VTSIYPNAIAPAGSDAVAAGDAMSQVDVASAILFAVNAPDSMDVDELMLTSRNGGRW
jgi:NADP-dependent 3-hydroxy acid dehydrogenase YdfG